MMGGHQVAGASRVSVLVQRLIVLAGFGVSLSDPSGEMDCETANRTASPGIVVAVCQREYERTRAPITGGRLADALRVSGRLDAASAVAQGLLTTPVRGDAFQILGKIAIAEHRTDDAVVALESARTIHREQGNRAEVARDGQALARIFAEREQYAEALVMLDECIVEAKGARDAQVEMYCRLAAARVLASVGSFELGQQELDRAEAAALSDRDKAWLSFERGNMYQEVWRTPLRAGWTHQAIAAFERTIKFATLAGLTDLVLLAEMNLAYSLAEIGKEDEADRSLATAKQLDLANEYESNRRGIAAWIAFHRGNLALAATLNEQTYPATDNADDRIDIATMQTRIAIQTNNLGDAERWARRGIEDVEKIRDQQVAIELRPWVLSTRRQPYELLFAVLARTGRAEDALLLFNQWQGRTLLDALARPESDPSAGLRSTAKGVQRLGEWWPVVSKAPFATRTVDRPELRALSKLDLLALVVADQRLFVITSHAGSIQVRDLGSYEQLRERLDRFATTPTERTLGEELGRQILSEDLLDAKTPLYVLLDAPLASLPVAALRSGGKPLISRRPIIRSLRIPDTTCTTVRRENQTVAVIADAGSDLRAARQEAEEIAQLFGGTLSVGAAATRQALFASARDSVLHVAVHADLAMGGGTLRLYDEPVSALEISASKLGPPLVVLSSCDSASSRDGELAGSLATAFLASGSRQVIATLRPVSDAGTRELTTRFYRNGGVADPVRVLASIQSQLAETTNTDWPNFAVFGHDVCRPNNSGD